MLHQNRGRAELSPLLVHVARAAAHAARHDPHARRTGEASTFVQLGHLAGLVVPARGVLAPGDNDLCESIDKIARAHLGHGRACRSFRVGLGRVKSYKTTDAIETAHSAVVSSTAVVYYYTGLAFGLTFSSLSQER